jgi:hypothetical protein
VENLSPSPLSLCFLTPTQFTIVVNAESPLAALFVRISNTLSSRYLAQLARTVSAN